MIVSDFLHFIAYTFLHGNAFEFLKEVKKRNVCNKKEVSVFTNTTVFLLFYSQNEEPEEDMQY